MPNCNALTNHMCVTVAASWRPCCRFNGFPHVDINETNFETYKDSKFYKSILLEMETGWAAGCSKCKTEEARGQTSLREVLNRDLSGTNDIEYIELSLSNNCNLACKMCSPTYSTTWNDLVIKHTSLQKYQSPNVQPSIRVADVFNNVDIKKLKKIKYLGGEPFITPEIRELFKYLDNTGIISNIEFECNTNCTLFPEKWLNYLSKFKKVNIELSIDGVGELNDYIRYGKNWNSIYSNILKWVKYKEVSPNLTISIFTTVQAYNLHNIKEIKELADLYNMKFYSSLLVVPDFLSVDVLPKNYLEEIKDDYNERYYKSIKDNTALFEKFKEFTNDADAATGLSIATIIPKLKNYMETQNG